MSCLAEEIMIGIELSFRISLQTSSPSMPGSVRSSIIRSNFSFSKSARPKYGSSTFFIFISNCSRYSVSISANSASSSIIKTFIICKPICFYILKVIQNHLFEYILYLFLTYEQHFHTHQYFLQVNY